METCVFLLFFFSSRRRHTRLRRDWSSDVCSSDLGPSFIDVETVLSSADEWPVSFLRGCGLPENFIANLPEFSNDAMRFERLLLWFVEEDVEFAERLIGAVRRRGVRCWPANSSASSESRDETKWRVGCTDVLIVCLSKAAIEHPQLEAAARSALARETLPVGIEEQQRRLLKVLDLDGAIDGSSIQSSLPVLADRVIGQFTSSAADGESFQRSDGRRAWKGGRSRWSPYH